METEKQLQTIEEELKLLKGELKQTLSSVRDYLLKIEPPSSEFTTILTALENGDDQTENIKGTLSLTPENEPEAEPADKNEGTNSSQRMDTKEPHISTEEELENQDEDFEPEEEPGMEEIFGEEEPQIEYERVSGELGNSIPKVNLLANLISWISLARREIGDEQLPTFLEVYGISGHLSPEMKDVILHLVEITPEKTGKNSMAKIWSNSMLSLHGILTGSDAPLNPIKAHWNEIDSELESFEHEPIEIDEETEEAPVKLKLVFPHGDGKGKEYSIDLTTEIDTNGSEN